MVFKNLFASLMYSLSALLPLFSMLQPHIQDCLCLDLQHGVYLIFSLKTFI